MRRSGEVVRVGDAGGTQEERLVVGHTGWVQDQVTSRRREEWELLRVGHLSVSVGNHRDVSCQIYVRF